MSHMKTRLPGELTFHGLLLLGSLFLLWQAYGISGFDSITSAGMFPMLSAAVMVGTAAVSLRQALKARLERSTGESLPAQFIRQISPAVFVSLSLAVAAFMLLLPRLGFVISAYVFLVVSMRLLGSKRWWFNAALSALTLLLVHVIFQQVFSVVLPKGTWLITGVI